MADLDLRPERRALLASDTRSALTSAVFGSRTWLRGSLASGTADDYSDIDICWVVPDGEFTAAVDAVAPAARSVGHSRRFVSTLTWPGRIAAA